MNRMLTALAVAGLAASVANAQVIDGTVDGSYGAPLSVQTVQTQFGDANPNGGSELNAAYARISGGRLYLMFTGNQEANFNKLNVFIDSRAGGENTLTTTPGYDNSNNGGVTWNSFALGGMTFDAGFTPDFHLFSRWNGGPFEVDFVDRAGGGSFMVPGARGASGAPVGMTAAGQINAGAVGPNASGSSLTQDLLFGFNNNNVLGVIGGTGAADQMAAAAVMTGMEFSISLADLGSPIDGTEIRISAMIGNGDHNYLSNQVLGGLPAPQGNLGGDGAGGFTGTLSGVNFNNFGGNQYFSIIVPAPSAAAVLGLGGLLLARRRR